MKLFNVAVSAAAIATLAGTAAAQCTPIGANILGNPGFENPQPGPGGNELFLGGWENFDNVFPEVANPLGGLISVGMFGTGAFNPSVLLQRVDGIITPGDRYRVTARATTIDGDSVFGTNNFGRVAMVYRDTTIPAGTPNVYEVGATIIDGLDFAEGDPIPPAGFSVEFDLVAPFGVNSLEVVAVFLQRALPDGSGVIADEGVIVFDDFTAQLCSTGNPVELVNPSFEEGGTFGHNFNGWRDFTAGFNIQPLLASEVEVDDGAGNPVPFEALDGDFVGQMFGQFQSAASDSVIFQTVPASPGEMWEAKINAYAPASDALMGNTVELSLQFVDAAGNITGDSALPDFDREGNNPVLIADNTTATNQWFEVSSAAEAPTGTVGARLLVNFRQPATFDSGSIFLDLASLEIADVVDPMGCNRADIAEPFNVLNASDINAFVAAFLASDADLNGDMVTNSSDINAFVADFIGGCS